MKNRTATAVWQGDLNNGAGSVAFGNGRFDQPYSAASRFEEGDGTNPEELIAAAHAACYSMALSNDLAAAGFTVERLQTKATVRLEDDDDGFSITAIDLQTQGCVPNIESDAFQKHAKEAKENCPVSKALAACDIRLMAELTQ